MCNPLKKSISLKLLIPFRQYSLAHVRDREADVDDDERYDDGVGDVEQINLIDSLLVQTQ